jgi:formimidoylglutamate deiminase
MVDHGPTADARPQRARGFALPGLTSLHSHAFQRGMAGLAEMRGLGPESFWTWREVMYRFLDRLTPDHVRAIAAMAYVEMVERGFTSVVEFHYLHHDIDGRPYAKPAAMADALVEAADEAGIGFTLLPTLYRFGGFGGTAPGHAQRRFISSPDTFAALVADSVRVIGRLDGAKLGIALHSLRAVGPDDVARAATLLPGALLHIHAAEQEKEVADCLAWSGKRPVQWLLDHAGVDGRWCVIHATHMDAAETRALAQSGAVAGLCPVTEANLGDGIFPATAYLEAGGRMGVGTDSNVLISVAEELRTLEYGQRLRDRQRVRLALPGQSVGERLLREALMGGAQASGRNPAADWLILDAEHETLAAGSTDTLMDRALFACPVLPIKEVWSAGTRLVADGRHVRGEAVRARFKAAMAKVSAAL